MDPESMDPELMDPELLEAARSGDTQKIIQLEDRGKLKTNEKTMPEGNTVDKLKINEKTTPEGNTVLHMAARFGRKQSVEEIVKRHRYLVLKSNHKGQTPVHIAARAGQLDVVNCFIKSVEKFSNIHIARVRDKYGNTPLHGAVRNGHHEVVDALAGHDKESLLLINDGGESPLSIAIDMKFTVIAKRIITLNPSTLEFIGHNGQTALHYAVLRHDSDSMNDILNSKEDLVRVQDEKKRTPLHYAAALGHQTMVEKLLQKNFSVAYTGDNNQQRPVHLAAKNGQTSLIKTLLDRCPDTIEIVDNKQRNILHLAAEAGNLDVVSHILKLDEMDDLINSPDADGNTPLHLATSNYYSDVVRVLSKNPKVEIRAINNFNKTALAIVKQPDDRGMELQKHLTLKALKRAYKMKAIDPEGILENTQLDDVEVEKASNIDGKKGRDMAQIISVMSTLIATFTFTAAFTLPGGFVSDGTDAGLATLIRRSAFQAFVISDTIAMTSSITSAVIVFWSMSRRDTESFMDILPFAIGLTWISLIAMALAFVTGLYVVLQKTLWLAILVCVIGCAAPFILYIFAPIFLLIFERVSKSETNITNRRYIVDDNPFFFIVRLIKMFVESQIQKLFECLSFSCKRSSCSCPRMCCSK